MKKNYNYLIVGAGLFGSVFAHEANKRNKSCLVIDKRKHIAGNVYTEEIEGIQVHRYGAHIFHTSNKEVWDYVNQLTEWNRFVNSPIALSKGKLYNLPFNMNTFNQLWGVITPEQAKNKIKEQRQEANIATPNNLKEQALKLVGKDIYETLIKEYTEKQWGKPCEELPAFIIKRIPVRFTFDNNYFNDKYQGIPAGGYTQMFEKMLEGSDVILDKSYKALMEADEYLFDKVIYTGPIDEFYNYQFGPLEYRGLKFDTKVFDEYNFQGNAVINYIDSKYEYTRIIEHKHFEFGEQPKTVITYEYPKDWILGDEPYYPINDLENEKIYKQYDALANENQNIVFKGRLGAYKYMNMDEIVLQALEFIKEELSK